MKAELKKALLSFSDQDCIPAIVDTFSGSIFSV